MPYVIVGFLPQLQKCKAVEQIHKFIPSCCFEVFGETINHRHFSGSAVKEAAWRSPRISALFKDPISRYLIIGSYLQGAPANHVKLVAFGYGCNVANFQLSAPMPLLFAGRWLKRSVAPIYYGRGTYFDGIKITQKRCHPIWQHGCQHRKGWFRSLWNVTDEFSNARATWEQCEAGCDIKLR